MNLPEEIAKFNREMQQNLIKPPAKISTHTAGRREGKHKHLTAGDRGYVPRTTDKPLNIKTAKRG